MFQSSISTFESIGLLITLLLGGLGMFLVVLVVTFLFAKIVTRSPEFERFGDQEHEALGDMAEVEDHVDGLGYYDRKDIFVIEDVEGCIVNNKEQISDNYHQISEPAPTPHKTHGLLANMSAMWHSLVSGKLKENLFGSNFIELQP